MPNNHFDVCRTERMLMYLEHAEQALDEMVRVLRPGGALILFEFDYGVLMVDSPNQPLTRRIGQIMDNSVPRSWIARQAPRLLRERGLEQVVAVPQMLRAPFAGYKLTLGGTLEQAIQAGQLDGAEVKEWWDTLEQAEAAGQFFAGMFGYIVTGRKPGA